MKLYKSLLAAVALVASSATFTGCDEDLAVPPLSIPVSDWKANTTIADFKTKYWSSEDNYYTEVGLTDEGEHVILGGRIVANDISGNIYQNLVLQDETAAVTIAVYMKDLNVKYKVGEEMFLDATGLFAGKYSGLFEIGKADTYTSGSTSTPQIGKMDEDVFLAHAQLNGLPKPDEVNVITMTIAELNAMKSNTDDLIKYQSQLIRLNGVSFKGGGTELWADRGTSHNTRYLYDATGASIAVDNSGMSDFNDQVLPAGHGDVIAILSYFRSGWQLVFRDVDDCIDFGGESYAPETPVAEGNGSAETPYNVGAVIGGATGTEVWVTGYIVGWIDGMSMVEGAKFTAPATVNSNLLLASKPDETNVGNCIPIALTNGTAVRTDLNLKDHADNLGKQVSIKGNLEKYFGSAGVKSTTAYAWGDKGDDSGTVTPPTPPAGDGDGSADKPYTADQIIAGASGTGIWFTGYIVGAVNDKSISDAAFTAPFALKTNILVAATAGEKDVTKCVPVQLPAGDLREALNLVDHADNLGKQIALKGDAAAYFGTKGMKNTAAYAWGGKGEAGAEPTVQYRKVSTVTSGKQYLIVSGGKAAKLSTASYGYLQVADVTDNGGVITADEANEFTFTAVTGGYNITMSNGKYVYQTGSYNSFNFSATSIDGDVWTVEPQSDGTFKITNVSTGKYVQLDSQYGNYGCYTDSKGSMPVLYEKVN